MERFGFTSCHEIRPSLATANLQGKEFFYCEVTGGGYNCLPSTKEEANYLCFTGGNVNYTYPFQR